MRYGYLPPPDPSTGQLQAWTAVTHAVKSMQRFAGLMETGVVGENDRRPSRWFYTIAVFHHWKHCYLAHDSVGSQKMWICFSIIGESNIKCTPWEQQLLRFVAFAIYDWFTFGWLLYKLTIARGTTWSFHLINEISHISGILCLFTLNFCGQMVYFSRRKALSLHL